MGVKGDSKLYFDVQMLELILKRHSLFKKFKNKNRKLIPKISKRIKESKKKVHSKDKLKENKCNRSKLLKGLKRLVKNCNASQIFSKDVAVSQDAKKISTLSKMSPLTMPKIWLPKNYSSPIKNPINFLINLITVTFYKHIVKSSVKM